MFDDPIATSTTSIYTLSFVGGMPYQNTTNNIAYQFNGLLSEYSATGAVNPSTLIAFSLDGNRKTPGATFANPFLHCATAPVGQSLPCRYVPQVAGCQLGVANTGLHNGELSFFSRSTGGAGWNMYNGQWPVSFADSHAKTQKIGVGTTGNTDARLDPFTQWQGTNGGTSAMLRWWGSPTNGTDLCHPYLFRPDVDVFNTTDKPFAG